MLAMFFGRKFAQLSPNLRRHDMDEARAEEDEEDGQHGPGQELQARVGHQVLHQPQPGLGDYSLLIRGRD